MACTIDGLELVDPRSFYAEVADSNPPIPVDEWFGRANGFDLVPVGKGPGLGWLLIRKEVFDKLDLTTLHVVKFIGESDASTYTIQNVTVTKAVCCSPGAADDAKAVYLLYCADKRYQYNRLPVDKAYNVRKADGSGYLEETLDTGSPWTWQDVVNDLAVDCSFSGDATLPYSPNGVPEDLTYWGGTAWEALNDVCARIGIGITIDHTKATLEFDFVQLGQADTVAAAVAESFNGQKTWDDYPIDPNIAWRPEKVRVRFLKRPRPTDGTSPYYLVDVTIASDDGVYPGSFVQIDDDEAALCDGTTIAATITNSATLATRASERANLWLDRRAGFGRPLLKVYRDFLPDIVQNVPGSTVGNCFLDDRGDAMRTGIESAPDSVLEEWKPFKQLPPWFPLDGGPTYYCDGIGVSQTLPPSSLETPAPVCLETIDIPAAGNWVILATCSGEVRIGTDTPDNNIAYINFYASRSDTGIILESVRTVCCASQYSESTTVTVGGSSYTTSSFLTGSKRDIGSASFAIAITTTGPITLTIYGELISSVAVDFASAYTPTVVVIPATTVTPSCEDCPPTCTSAIAAAQDGPKKIKLTFAVPVTVSGSISFYPAGAPSNHVAGHTQPGTKTVVMTFSNSAGFGSSMSIVFPAGANGIATVGGGIYVCAGTMVVDPGP